MQTVHRHLINLRRIVLFNITQYTNIVILDEIYRNTLAAKTTRATDAVYGKHMLAINIRTYYNDYNHVPMNIQLTIVG